VLSITPVKASAPADAQGNKRPPKAR
jgi:hypothetical protein